MDGRTVISGASTGDSGGQPFDRPAGRSTAKKPGQPVNHPFPPVWSDESRILILGTMPSQQSRRQGFYYGNPQNRFWKMLAVLLEDSLPATPDERRAFLLRHRIALWDVLQSCEITGSSDSSIHGAVANDIAGFLAVCPVRAILANGQSAARLYQQLCEPLTGRPCWTLPSTSPANGRYSLAALCVAWQSILPFLA